MINLSGDIHFMILEYIITKEDLKNLCLTSRKFHAHIIPRLYERVDIRLCSPPEVTRFIRCVAMGAGMNLRHTRTLVIEDARKMPKEPESIHSGQIPKIKSYHGEDYDESARDVYLRTILNMFPQHGLRRFCFIAERQLDLYIHGDMLSVRQKSLTEMRGPVDLDAAPSYGMHHLDILLPAGIRVNFNCFREEIYSLRLTGQMLDRIYDWEFKRPPTQPQLDTNLKSLTLSNLDIRDIFEPLSQYCNFPALTHLSLLQCRAAGFFISGLMEAMVKRPDPILRLEHLAVDFDEQASNSSALGGMFAMCDPLKSLHIHHLRTANYQYDLLVENICSSGEHLRLLSFGMVSHSAKEPLSQTDFDKVCEACPNLQQLSYQLQEDVYHFPEADQGYDGGYTNFMNSLSKLRHLRLLHLRLNQIHFLGRKFEYGFSSLPIVSSQIQRFANKFFGDLKRTGSCPLLNALVIGHVSGPEPGDGNAYACPRFCFLRAEQRDGLNRTAAVGVPVSRAMLRATQPYTNVLDYDTDTKPWEQWADRAMA